MSYSTAEFETLYTGCFPMAMRMAQSLLNEQDEARDAVHEVFLKLWESEVRMTNPQAFIVRSVRNACLNRLNRLDVQQKVKQHLSLTIPDDDYDPEQQNREVQDAIVQVLTSREREVLTLIYTNSLSYKDAAAALEISTSAINKNIVSALKKLRTYFKNDRAGKRNIN